MGDRSEAGAQRINVVAGLGGVGVLRWLVVHEIWAIAMNSFVQLLISSCKFTQSSRLHQAALRWLQRGVVLTLLVCVSPGRAGAQAAAEYAKTTATTGAAVTQAKPPIKIDSASSPENKPGSAHLVGRTAEPAETTNRRALEERAGKDAARLILRSVPNNALVRIDGKRVGSTPLLLILAPGGYKVEMEGARTEFASRQVDLLPRETREVVLSLQSRYPARVRLR